MSKATRKLKTAVTILATLIPAIATVTVAYMQIEAEKQRGWDRYDIIMAMEEDKCDDAQTEAE